MFYSIHRPERTHQRGRPPMDEWDWELSIRTPDFTKLPARQ